MKKTILLLLLTAFFFSACNKCQECENDDWGYANGEDGPYIEVCRDNFDDRNAYEDYIEAMEDDGFDCKSDFWN